MLPAYVLFILLDMKVAGVAAGTLIAQYAGFLMALWLYMRYYHTLHKRIVWKEIIQRQAMYRFFQVNRDIFFRTLCLVHGHYVFHLGRSSTRRSRFSRQHFAYAIIHLILLYHGWLCLCR